MLPLNSTCRYLYTSSKNDVDHCVLELGLAEIRFRSNVHSSKGSRSVSICFIRVRVRVRVRVTAGVSGNAFSVKRVFEQVL